MAAQTEALCPVHLGTVHAQGNSAASFPHRRDEGQDVATTEELVAVIGRPHGDRRALGVENLDQSAEPLTLGEVPRDRSLRTSARPM